MVFRMPWRVGSASLGLILLSSISLFGMKSDSSGFSPREYIRGIPKSEIVQVYKSAPAKFVNIIEHLKTGKIFREKPAACILYGDPGVGKSTLAMAANMMAGWDIERLSPSSFKVEGGRGSTAREITRQLNGFVKEKAKLVIVIDEIDHLMENFHDPHYDTKENSEALWQFIDAQACNPNLMIIGTANAIDTLPKEMIRRVINFLIHIDAPRSFEEKKEIFKFHMQGLTCDISDLSLKKIFDDFDIKTGCDIKIIILEAENLFREKDKQNDVVLNETLLSKAAQKIQALKKFTKVYLRRETIQEQTERLAIEQMLNSWLLAIWEADKDKVNPMMKLLGRLDSLFNLVHPSTEGAIQHIQQLVARKENK